MKIILFADGKAGEVKTLPGEQPLAEIGELLGCTDQEPEMRRLTDRLRLCINGNGGDPAVKYAYLRQWRGLAEAQGTCAVVRMAADGTLRDVTKDDIDRANELVWPVWE